jgi:predicted component of type VI protein secretion system
VAKLVLLRADGRTAEVMLHKERVTIGRRSDNDVCLPDRAVSGEHAAVLTILADSFVEDLRSTNGTQVNGAPLTTRRLLRDRDEIEIGGQRLVYLADDGAVLAPLAELPARTPARRGTDRAKGGAARGRSAPMPGPTAAVGLMPGEGSLPHAVSAPVPDDAPAAAVRAIDRFVTAEVDRQSVDGTVRMGGRAGDAPPAATPAAREELPGDGEAPAAPAAAAASGRRPAAVLHVRTGPHAGHAVPLAKDETLLGRIGVQAVAIRREGATFHAFAVDGAVPPLVNGVPIPPAGSALQPGDVLEVAGARIELQLDASERP